MKRVTLVLVTQHAESLVEAALDRLRAAGLLGERSPAFVRVVCRGMSARSVGQLAVAYPGIEVAGVPATVGFARAANAGLSELETSFALLLTPGVAVDRNALDTMIQHLRENPHVAAVGPLQVDESGRTVAKVASFPTPATEIARRLPRSAAALGLRVPAPRMRHAPGPVDWLPANCLLLRRRALEHVGLFDEACAATFEAADWCRRASRGEWQVHLQPAARVRTDTSIPGRLRSSDRIESLRRRLAASRRHYFRVHHGVASAALVEVAHGLGRVLGARRPWPGGARRAWPGEARRSWPGG